MVLKISRREWVWLKFQHLHVRGNVRTPRDPSSATVSWGIRWRKGPQDAQVGAKLVCPVFQLAFRRLNLQNRLFPGMSLHLATPGCSSNVMRNWPRAHVMCLALLCGRCARSEPPSCGPHCERAWTQSGSGWVGDCGPVVLMCSSGSVTFLINLLPHHQETYVKKEHQKTGGISAVAGFRSA